MSNVTYLLAGAQPSWYPRITELQLRALLNLGALFSETVYITDTQLADNPHLYQSFLSKGENQTGLYGRLKAFLEAGVVRPLLRDQFYLADQDKLITCDSLTDVYRAWLEQSMPGAWVLSDQSKNREAFLQSLEKIVAPGVVRYDYLTIKRQFMESIRAQFKPDGPMLIGRLVNNLPDNIKQQYLSIITRPYFSHSDLYNLAKVTNLSRSHPLIYAQGLVDEAAYAALVRAGLFGSDPEGVELGDLLDEPETTAMVRAEEPAPTVGLEDLVGQQAERVWETADFFQLIGLLSPVDVLNLREKGRHLFEMRVLAADVEDAEVAATRRHYLDSLEEYWDSICEAVAVGHRNIATHPTRVGVFVLDVIRRLPPELRRVASLIIDIPFEFVPGQGLRDKLRALRDQLSIRILLSETPEMRRLRRALPRRSWLVDRPSFLETAAAAPRQHVRGDRPPRLGGGGQPGALLGPATC